MGFLLRWIARPIAVYLFFRIIETCQSILVSFMLGLTCFIACIWMVVDIFRSIP